MCMDRYQNTQNTTRTIYRRLYILYNISWYFYFPDPAEDVRNPLTKQLLQESCTTQNPKRLYIEVLLPISKLQSKHSMNFALTYCENIYNKM
jgi:hypothetical protein